jgi:hypothetical protein
MSKNKTIVTKPKGKESLNKCNILRGKKKELAKRKIAMR